jgi:hypothetical protein
MKSHFVGLTMSAALLGTTLSSCSQVTKAPPADLLPSRCTPGVCVVQVFVDACTVAGGIRLDKPLVEVTDAVNMRWEIVTPGFEFDANGIAFDPPNPQFQVQQSPRSNEFRLHNAKSQSGDFYYSVNVKGCVRHDPWVRNL